jgi:hypothetical protein
LYQPVRDAAVAAVDGFAGFSGTSFGDPHDMQKNCDRNGVVLRQFSQNTLYEPSGAKS